MPDLTNVGFARRHLWKVLGLGAAAVVANATMLNSAQAHDDDDTPVCFLKGTKIRTPEGERAIEDLAPGGLVLTLRNGPRPIQSVAHREFSKPWSRETVPVRIARSAFATAVPYEDLYVSPGHAISIDGKLMMAGSLVNGLTITQADALDIDELEYFHIKLSSHHVIYAAGLSCESLAGGVEEYEEYPLPLSTRRLRMKSHLRSALSPWIDRRERVDVIRDQLDARAKALVA